MPNERQNGREGFSRGRPEGPARGSHGLGHRIPAIGVRLRPGHVYIAPPNRHLLVNPDDTLSLTGEDGAMALTAIKKTGGTVIVQDPRTAEFSGMPEAAVKTGTADFVLGLEEIAPALQTLCATGVKT